VSDQGALAAELRRLRAALGASAEELTAAPGTDLAHRLDDELRFLWALVTARSDDPAAATAELLDLWRELRLRATALAADLPSTADSVRLLRERLARDEAEMG
jgi:hypothetical protein